MNGGSPITVGTPPLSGEAVDGVGPVPFRPPGCPLPFDSPLLSVPFDVELLFAVGGLLVLLVLFGGSSSEPVPLLLDSGRGGAPLLVRLVMLLLLLVLLLLICAAPAGNGPLETCAGVVLTGGGYGRLGGGNAAGAGDGAGTVEPDKATGLALPAIPKGPLLSGGRPVVGKSNFLGADGTPEDTDTAVVVLPVIP